MSISYLTNGSDYIYSKERVKEVITLKTLHIVSFLLVIVGALNWGFIGLLNFNLVEALFGVTGLVGVVYILVGAAAVYVAATHMGDCKICSKRKK